jgi:hypothetical protein
MIRRVPSKGIFTKWQPRYAEKRIATFPVGSDKKPQIKRWNQIGLKGSAKLAERFTDANAFGFPLGPRSGVTLMDLDTKAEGLLDEIQSRYGQSPFIVETGGVYYKYGGERRHIRPWGADTPVDVLGGGYAVAPPSVAAKGRYQIVHGTLDDLKNLPPLHAMLDELRKPIEQGKRNHTLFRAGLEQATHVDDFETLLDVMRTHNLDCETPLPDSEVIKATRSAWKYEREGRNLVGRGRAIVISHNLLDRVMAKSHDAFILLTVLKRHHWGRDFVLSNAMANALGWGLPRWQRARDLLVRLSVIACILEGGFGPNDPPIYAWADSLGWGVNAVKVCWPGYQ